MSPVGIIAMTGTEENLDRFKESDFNRISSFILSACGICLPPTKKVMVDGRLRRRAHRLGIGTLAEYLNLVFDAAFIFGWSGWRRQHQTDAALAHYRSRHQSQL